jgi:hypothetical protein
MSSRCRSAADNGRDRIGPDISPCGATSELPVIADLEELTEFVTRQQVFLRYSEHASTEDGPSLDYESGVELPGLSVTTLAPEPWWPRSSREWVARRLCKYAELGSESGRRAWLLRGREVARGPDHEPVIADVTPIAIIDDRVIDHARQIYRDRFDTGRDSRD